MQLTTRLPKRRTTRPTKTPEPTPVSPEVAERRDARRGGGPVDRALYSCMCGYVFTEKVSTTVACPNCGTEQAW